MSRPRPILTDSAAGRVEPVRLGVRLGAASPDAAAAVHFAPDALATGTRSIGGLEISLELQRAGAGARVSWSVRNVTRETLALESLVLGVRWLGPPGDDLRFLRHGWQSWSYTGSRELDAAGEPPFPSGPWLRGLHHAVSVPPTDRSGWHESATLSVVGCAGAACLVGALETGRSFSSVYLRRAAVGVELEVELHLEVPLAPGQSRELECLRIALGADANALLESFAELWGRAAGARTRAPFQAGWCSWYHFFDQVSESDMLRNLEQLAAKRDSLGVDVVQLDDGYQRAVGDWRETNDRFPRGLAFLAGEIAAAGFRPGLWTAPFCAVPESRLFAEHPDWMLRHDGEPALALLHPDWSKRARVHALDTGRNAVRAHLTSLFQDLAEMGFHYHKLDFLYAAGLRTESADPQGTRAQRLQRGLGAIRSGAGEDAFLLGCGCPLGPAVGLVDGMRIGPDVAPRWQVDPAAAIPGLEATQPSLENALRSIANRAWMHRRLWLNDPDCLLARSRDSDLTRGEVRALAGVIATTGGMAVFSDDLSSLTEADRQRVGETVALARAVDAAGSRGVARALDMLAAEAPRKITARSGGDALIALLNPGPDRSRVVAAGGAPAAESGPLEPLLGSPAPESASGAELRVRLDAHAGGLYRRPGARQLAVFCDYDGTFAVQDVGASIARRWAAERRPALWARYERGELDAWSYNRALFEGLPLPESELDRFLAGIEIDPGAPDLLEWCAQRGTPFRILSDGFDHNLDRLQRLHGVRFAYDANQLRYESGRWRISPGHPDPGCGCGTGTCKRGRIAAYRTAHPGAFCVHVGNGRVSDLCGAIEADVCFAKDSLPAALEARGIAYEPFETLRDVLRELEQPGRYPG